MFRDFMLEGIDLRNMKITIDGKNRCGNLQWVPFLEHPKGVNFIPRFNDTTEDPLDLPYDKTSVWYDPHLDGVGAGMISREVTEINEDSAAKEDGIVEEEAAHIAHKKEAEKLAGGSLHVAHQALAETLKAEGGQIVETGHREVISNAAAAALKAVQTENEGVQIFPPLLRGGADVSIPKGRFHLSPVKLMSKHGVEHLPIQVQLSVVVMIIGIFIAVVATAGNGKGRKRTAKLKKSG